MRPLSEQQTRTLQARPGYAVRFRVLVSRGGTDYDLSALPVGGKPHDWLREVSVTEDVDAPTATSTVTVSRQILGASLAPLEASYLNQQGGQYAPLIWYGRVFAVQAAVLPLGSTPRPSDWLELFRGKVEAWDMGGDALTFQGRDFIGGTLHRAFLEEEREYGSAAGTAIQTVMQALLADAGHGAFGLYTPVNPLWDLGPYLQRTEPVLDALRALASQLGWDVRQRWRPDTGTWALTLWSPDRAGTTPVWTLHPGTYRELGEVRGSWEDLRNAVSGVYYDRQDLDAAGQPKRKVIHLENAASIAAYERLWCRLAEGATSNIRTAAEMTRLLQAVLDDLSQPPIGVQVETALLPALELGDLVRLEGDGKHFSSGQQLAVQKLNHVGNAAGGKTRLVLSGKPSVSRRSWLEREARPGIAPAAPFTGPAAPSGLAVTNLVGGAALTFTAPDVSTGPEAVEYELHIGDSAGFSLSAATLKAVSSTTRFELGDLPPGTTRYARVRSRDRKGNVGPASAEVSLLPRYVAPTDIQPQVIYSSLTPNPSLEAWTLGPSHPPDAWHVASGTWGIDFVRSSTSYSGSHSIAVTSASVGSRLLVSQYLSVSESQIYVATLRYLQPAGTVGITGARMELRWYNASFVEIGPSASILEGTAVGTWQLLSRHATAPPGARYARIFVGRNPPASSNPVFVDACAVDAYGPAQETPRPVSAFYSGFTSGSPGGEGRAEFYRASTGEVQMQGSILPPSGIGLGVHRAFYISEPPLEKRRFRVATASGVSLNLIVNTDGFVDVQNPSSGDAIHLAQIRYRLS